MQFGEIRSKLHGIAVDSLMLTFVKVVTAALGLLTTKLLSTQFSLHEYGTYSQVMLLVSTSSSIIILGLTDATNYFFNSADDEVKKQQNIGTIFCIQYIVGIFVGVLICAFSIPITKYFNNPDLQRIVYIAAWMPVFYNLIPMFQVLFISIGKAKVIAIRNFIVSLARLLFVSIASFVTKEIKTIIILILILDVAQTVYFYYSFSKDSFRIKVSDFRIELIKPIITFSIPMAVFIFTSAFSRDLDKYVIGYFTETQTLAIYTNAAKVLPFDLFTASLLTVLIPIATRQVRSESYFEAQNTLKAYLRTGYLVTWILVTGAIVNAKEMMLLFYDEKYLPGLGVFIIYLFVDMMRFASISLFLSAKGKTKTLMKWSIISLLANFVLNIVAYLIFGIIGPALTTLLITIGLSVVILAISAKEINTTFLSLFDWKEVLLEIGLLIIVGSAAYMLKKLLVMIISSYVAVLIITYGVYLGIMLLINRKRLIDSLRTINRLKI